jgi:hypothetical protein
MLVDAGFQAQHGAAAGRPLLLQALQQGGRMAEPAPGRVQVHALELALAFDAPGGLRGLRCADHQRPAADGTAAVVARDHEHHLGPRQRGQVDAVVALGRVQRLLVGVQRVDQRAHLGLVGTLRAHGRLHGWRRIWAGSPGQITRVGRHRPGGLGHQHMAGNGREVGAEVVAALDHDERMASAVMPTMRSSSRSSSCFLPLTTATRMPSISRQALGPRFTDTPVIIGPFSVQRPSLTSASTL